MQHSGDLKRAYGAPGMKVDIISRVTRAAEAAIVAHGGWVVRDVDFRPRGPVHAVVYPQHLRYSAMGLAVTGEPAWGRTLIVASPEPAREVRRGEER
jgi:hypothetical protein